jgi:riboflavin synthase
MLAVFTGLVEATGKLEGRAARGPGFRLSIESGLEALELGESISVNGACLTVAAFDQGRFELDLSLETAQKTTLGRLPIGAELNLERSMRIGDRLGGHLVSGHVDGIARVIEVGDAGEAKRVRIEAPEPLRRYLAPKGSVCLDGVSLTVNTVGDAGFEIMLIPHTLTVTNLKAWRAGVEVNLEVDLLARYVVHYIQALDPRSGPPGSRS